MAPSGFDYSKWDKLELSDDEDDHPGAKFIEENTLRRIKRESHERQEAERAERVEKLEKQIKKDKKRVKELLLAAGGPDAGADDPAEISRLNAAIAESESSLAKEARERKFNADEMCHVANERSLVGAACKPDVGDENLDYESYAKKYGPQLDAAAATHFGDDYRDMAEFFKNNVHLLTEHSVGYLLLKCLYAEMAGDTAAMRLGARVGYALKSIGDFADAGRKQMKDAARPFFNRLDDEPRVRKEYDAALEDYCQKLIERAAVKKREEAEEAAARQAAGEDDGPKSLEEIPRRSGWVLADSTRWRCSSRFRRRCKPRSRAGAWTRSGRSSTNSRWKTPSITCEGWWTAVCGSPRRDRRVPRCETNETAPRDQTTIARRPDDPATVRR